MMTPDHDPARVADTLTDDALWVACQKDAYEFERKAMTTEPRAVLQCEPVEALRMDEENEPTLKELLDDLRDTRRDKPDLIFYRMPFTMLDNLIAAIEKVVG